jgi:hypothetical protein
MRRLGVRVPSPAPPLRFGSPGLQSGGTRAWQARGLPANLRSDIEMGRCPSWPMGAGCKPAGASLQRYESSPPHSIGCRTRCCGSTRRRVLPRRPPCPGEGGAVSWVPDVAERAGAGVAQLVEHQPSKLRVAGSSPVSRSTLFSLQPRFLAVDRVRPKARYSGSKQSPWRLFGVKVVRGSYVLLRTASKPPVASRPRLDLAGSDHHANAHVAQLVEHVLGKDEVSGSIPLVGSSD